MVVPCKMLSNITKTLPDAAVTFEVEERAGKHHVREKLL